MIRIIITTLIALTFGLGPVGTLYAAYTKADAQNIVTLIKKNYQSKFCSPGGLFAKTIRSKDGDLCVDPLRASLAIGVCTGFDDFGNSKCQSKAIAAINKAMPGTGGSQDAALAIITNNLNPNNAKAVCNSIGEFLPDLVAKCTFLVGASMPEPIPGAKPAATVAAPSKALNVAWQAVEKEKHGHGSCQQLINLYNGKVLYKGSPVSLNELKEVDMLQPLSLGVDPFNYDNKLYLPFRANHSAFLDADGISNNNTWPITLLTPRETAPKSSALFISWANSHKATIDIMAPVVYNYPGGPRCGFIVKNIEEI